MNRVETTSAKAIIIILMMVSVSAIGQSRNQWLKLAEEARDDEDPVRVAACLKEVYILDSSDFDITVQYADALRQSRDYKEAERLYDKSFAKDKGKINPDGQFYLALMQKYQGKYEAALRNFQKYAKKNKRSGSDLAERAVKEADGCTLALNSREARGVRVSALEGNINTSVSEFSAYLIDSTLFYTGQSGSFLGIKRANKSGNAYTVDEAYKFKLSNQVDFGNLVFSPDGQRAYYSECRDSTCVIFEAQVTDGSIHDPESIAVVNQIGIRSTMPWIGVYDGKEVLFYSSNRRGTRGGMDIWWSFRNSNGQWEPPVNAGDNVNTTGDEVCPYYLNNQLFFSSDGHPGFGGYDIFRSRGWPRSFDIAENMQAPINSSVNDLYYRYFESTAQGYLSSNRTQPKESETFCCNDLFLIEFADSLKQEIEEPKVYQSLAELNYYLPVTLYFHNDEPNPNSRDTTTALSYQACYDSYYKLKEKYERENTKGMGTDEKEDALIDVSSFYTLKLDKGINDLNTFCDLLLKELEKGYSVELTIKGFASPRAKSDYNVNLTRRRIASLQNYMSDALGGVFKPYIEANAVNHATLRFVAVPFGEYAANQTVSDELTDEKESIYSLGARMERKIEIQSVQRGMPDSLFAAIQFSEQVIDLGPIVKNSKFKAQVLIQNTGTDTLTIDSIPSSCSCTIPVLKKQQLLPGDRTTVDLEYESGEQSGVFIRKVFVFTNVRDEPFELVVTGEQID
jgi:hypothetical protein